MEVPEPVVECTRCHCYREALERIEGLGDAHYVAEARRIASEALNPKRGERPIKWPRPWSTADPERD
jgi:hypothetical protein